MSQPLIDAKKLASGWPDVAQTARGPLLARAVDAGAPEAAGRSRSGDGGRPDRRAAHAGHPVALALLRACGFPLAAPSANRSTELSPTLPEHVLAGLVDRIDLLLDAGPTSGGLESTVLDLTTHPPTLLRPGLVTIAELEALVGPINRASAKPDEPLRSPGQLDRHYAPRTPLELTDAGRERVELLARQGLRVGWLTHLDESAPAVLRILLPADPVSYSARLYAALHQLDKAGLDRIIVQTPPAGDDWLAVHDRLRRAGHK